MIITTIHKSSIPPLEFLFVYKIPLIFLYIFVYIRYIRYTRAEPGSEYTQKVPNCCCCLNLFKLMNQVLHQNEEMKTSCCCRICLGNTTQNALQYPEIRKKSVTLFNLACPKYIWWQTILPTPFINILRTIWKMFLKQIAYKNSHRLSITGLVIFFKLILY